ncbi:hypothetical protein MPLB_1490090 [Mesorhizobium sp. ORS 3324]|nr:hypothetical protein MPLB_1490090 [Mesorhizobium sp. ORS 3324]
MVEGALSDSPHAGTTVRASDKRAVFVGLEAYQVAGGIIMRDLFQDDGGGWLQDVAPLEKMAADKLKGVAGDVAAEGWKWIEVTVSFPYDATRGLRSLQGEPLDLTAEEQATIDALTVEYQKLEAEYEGADELLEGGRSASRRNRERTYRRGAKPMRFILVYTALGGTPIA